VFVYTPKRNILSILQLQLFPIAFPIGVSNSLDALVPEEILAVDTRFCHSGLSVVEESHDMNLFRNHAKLQNEINFGVAFIEEFT
jgi:ABC-type cobalamin transport system ATPase subunit